MRSYVFMDRGPGETGFRVWLRKDGVSVRVIGAETLGEVYRIGEKWEHGVVATPRPAPATARSTRPVPRVTLRARLAALLSFIPARA